MPTPRLRFSASLTLLSFALLIVPNLGCVGLMANLIHAGWGNLADARFDELALSKVAVICMSHSTSFGNDTASEYVAQRVETNLKDRVPEIVIVDQQAVHDWMDQNDWNEMDYRELADGLDVDYLIAIDLEGMTLYEGPTLYKGRAEVDMRVYKSSTGEVAYEIDQGAVQFPANGGIHVADTPEKSFKKQFLEVIAGRLSRHFYSYDVKEDYGRDPTFVVQ